MKWNYRRLLDNVTDPQKLVLNNYSTFITGTKLPDADILAEAASPKIVREDDAVSTAKKISSAIDVGLSGCSVNRVLSGNSSVLTVETDAGGEAKKLAAISYSVSSKRDFSAMRSTINGMVAGFSTVALSGVECKQRVIGGSGKFTASGRYAGIWDKSAVIDAEAEQSVMGIDVTPGGSLSAVNGTFDDNVRGFKNVRLSGGSTTGSIIGGRENTAAEMTVKKELAGVEIVFGKKLSAAGTCSLDNGTMAETISGYKTLLLSGGSLIDRAMAMTTKLSFSVTRRPAGTSATDKQFAATTVNGEIIADSAGKAELNAATADSLMGYTDVSVNAGNLSTAIGGKYRIGVNIALTQENTAENEATFIELMTAQDLYAISVTLIIRAIEQKIQKLELDYDSLAAGSFTGRKFSDPAMIVNYKNLELSTVSGKFSADGGAKSCSLSATAFQENNYTVSFSASIFTRSLGTAKLSAVTMDRLSGYDRVSVRDQSNVIRLFGGDVNFTLNYGYFAVNAADSTWDASGNISMTYRARATCELSSSKAGFSAGIRNLTIGPNATSEFSLGGNIGFTGVVAVDKAKTSVTELAMTIKSTGKLTGSAGEGDLAAGYLNVKIAATTVYAIFGGNMSLSGTSEFDTSEFEPVSLSSLTVPDILRLVIGGLTPKSVKWDIHSAGAAEITGASKVLNILGYKSITVKNSSIDSAIGGTITGAGGLPVSSLARRRLSLTAVATDGWFKAENSTIGVVLGYKKVTLNGGVAANVHLSRVSPSDAPAALKGSSLTINGTKLDNSSLTGFNQMTFSDLKGEIVKLSCSSLNDTVKVKNGTVKITDMVDFGDGVDTLSLAKGGVFAASVTKISGLDRVEGGGTLLIRQGALPENIKIASSVKVVELPDDAFATKDDSAATAVKYSGGTAEGRLSLFDTADWVEFSLQNAGRLDLGELEDVACALYSVGENGELTLRSGTDLSAGDYKLEFTLSGDALSGKYGFSIA
ncbi:MAG: hypothetical protein PHI85_04255 [Victivallaceae bacterium]|nr:hypothetical protein [Victivallaceae bacterium]